MENQILGKRLKELCEQKGVSYAELAEKTGVSKRSIMRLVFGAPSSTSVFRMIAICDVLGVTLDEFFNAEEFMLLKKK